MSDTSARPSDVGDPFIPGLTRRWAHQNKSAPSVSGWQRRGPETRHSARIATQPPPGGPPAKPCGTTNSSGLAHGLPMSACGTVTHGKPQLPASCSPQAEEQRFGSNTMPAIGQLVRMHRTMGRIAAARSGGSVPYRCMVRASHAQHAARCIHASAERRLQARCPHGASVGAGRWPFHCCAICAPPSCRFLPL
jgi:hypothetical protein